VHLLHPVAQRSIFEGAHLLHSSAHLPLPYSGDGHWSKRPQVRFHELKVFPTPMKRKTYNLQTIHSLMRAPQHVVSAVAGSISQSNLPTALEFDLVFLKIGLLSYKSVLVHMRLLR
jgi:hypothetical protein